MQQKWIGFIGGGNMAQAIVGGLVKQGYPANKIIVSDPNEEKRQYFKQLYANATQDNLALVEQSEVIVLAVKPQVLAQVCQPFQHLDLQHKLVISIAAGISLQKLTALLPSAKQIVRVMPNTPALVSEGMSGLFAEHLSTEWRDFTQSLLSAVGKTQWLENEQQMHAVIAGSGSSPAYFFFVMEAMQKVLEEMDLDPQMARQLVQQSALGAAKMAMANPQLDFATLRKNVTSKGGTTAAALAIFEQQQVAESIKQAMQACVARSQQMEQQL